MASEEITKGIVAGKLSSTDAYSEKQNLNNDGIIWFKEDSFKGTSYDWLKDIFAKASKKQNMTGRGTPDFMVVKEKSNVIVVIECKAEINASGSKHSMFDDIEDYKEYGYGTPAETEHYAINGALYYATFLNQDYDVVAVGVSGQNEAELRVTSFILPKGGDISDIEVLEDGGYGDMLVSINQYEKDIEIALDRFAATEHDIRKELRKYTLSCANFLRANGIEDNSKAGFVSAIILGLTNKDSRLYKDTKAAIDKKNISKAKKMIDDTIGKESIKMLKASLYGDGKDEYDDDYIKGVWDIDKIPKGKRRSLKKFYDHLLSKDELTKAPKNQGNYFKSGNTVLSCCIYSLYENVIEILEHYSGIDVMGEFYTTFLRFTKGNAKEKGIVLTPKHITELFCDIAEYYGGSFTENTKIIDTCCGTGAFLISSLNRIKKNIYDEHISEEQKEERYSKAQKYSLIGVERDASMYALSYANMRFHGDGKSNLFNCSSLMSDSYNPVDDSGMTYLDDKKVPLSEALQSFGNIDVGMINPPYSLGKNDDKKQQNYPEGTAAEICIQKGQDELDFIASMLHYLKDGGIGIAIVPMSCASNSGKKLRKEILKHHTLLACMSMPAQLFFDSHVGANTCIMVFKAHERHNENKATFFARWQDDGFRVITHNGRKDAGSWNQIRKEWLEQLDGIAEPNDIIFLKKKIKIGDEALAEAYIKTDYSKLSDADFERTLKKYALFKYMDENGLWEV